MNRKLSHLLSGSLSLAANTASGALVEINLLDNFVESNSAGDTSSFSSILIPGGSFVFMNAYGALYASSGVLGVNATTNRVELTASGSNFAAGLRAYGNGVDDFNAIASGAFAPPDPLSPGNFLAGSTPQSLERFLLVGVSHTGINGGQTTSGLLQFALSSTTAGQRLEFQRLIFEDGDTNLAPTDTDPSDNIFSFFDASISSTDFTEFGRVENGVFTLVPEPSSLSLLALGAGGLITRRRRKAQKEAV